MNVHILKITHQMRHFALIKSQELLWNLLILLFYSQPPIFIFLAFSFKNIMHTRIQLVIDIEIVSLVLVH
jgi:hypothetical protein